MTTEPPSTDGGGKLCVDTGRTSEPLGVVLDGPEDGSAVSQTSVDDGVAGEEVRHGGRVKVSP